ncbi:hypothetical protein L1987_15626 [Smallanthus sonchifolius]|uniref:Uncharacterized protein n=1 Tax=Smallanthus sonchifolius TaxID=185202 RepID=A0ACB9J752_9ASTR|nr:hypothetical protein L1987_15626 [Smallanthus sonchifolius]
MKVKLQSLMVEFEGGKSLKPDQEKESEGGKSFKPNEKRQRLISTGRCARDEKSHSGSTYSRFVSAFYLTLSHTFTLRWWIHHQFSTLILHPSLSTIRNRIEGLTYQDQQASVSSFNERL